LAVILEIQKARLLLAKCGKNILGIRSLKAAIREFQISRANENAAIVAANCPVYASLTAVSIV